jgi:hypothetical protein
MSSTGTSTSTPTRTSAAHQDNTMSSVNAQNAVLIGEYYADHLIHTKFKNLLISTEMNAEIEHTFLGAPYAASLVLALGMCVHVDCIYVCGLRLCVCV